MVNTLRLIFAVGLIYFIASWAVNNPKSASSMIDNIDAAIIWVNDLVSDKIFDKEEGA